MAYVEFPVPAGNAPGIKRFYEKVFDAPSTCAPEPAGTAARVKIGSRQELVFRETAAALARL